MSSIDAFDRPAASAAGDEGREGFSSAAARADHVHPREAADTNLSSTAGNISQVDVGDAASAGALTTGARADHQHALPTPAAPTTSAVADAASAGSATTVARADHRHGREAFATASDIADIAATESAGTASTVARGDHVHADPAKAAWSSYVPVIGGAGWALGNGTITGDYIEDGKSVTLHIVITFGSTSTFGSGGMTVTLPVTAAAANVYGVCSARQSAGSGIRFPGVCRSVTTTKVQPLATQTNGGAGTFVSEIGYTTSAPFAWASGDQVFLDVNYQAA